MTPATQAASTATTSQAEGPPATATGIPRPPASPRALAAKAQTTSGLQSPTGYTGIYENWNLDLD